MKIKITAAMLVMAYSVSTLANAPVFSPVDLETRVKKLERMLESRSQVNTHLTIQNLEQEVRSLSGTIEELNYKIAQLEKRQTQFALDFDKRLNQANPNVSQSSQNSFVPKTTNSDSRLLSEEGAYQNAYQLVKAGDYDGAIRAFRAFLELYPNKPYAVNAHYWLGELYLAKQDYQNSEKEFNWIVNENKEHRKAPDALVKLGFLHFENGNVDKSQEIFNQVIKRYPNSPAASLAKTKLQKIRVN